MDTRTGSSRPLGMKEGFLFAGGLLLLGLVLQAVVGEVRWAVLAWPVNLFLLLAWLVIILDIWFLRRRVRFFEWMMHNGAGVPALVFALVLTLIMGLVTQESAVVHPGTSATMPWLGRMLRFWPFVLAWGWVVLIAGLAALNHLSRWRVREIPFVLNHLGLFVAVAAAALGAPDKQDLKLMAFPDTPEWRAVDGSGALVELDFDVTLHKFIMESYSDGSPRRFASEVTVAQRGAEVSAGSGISGTVEVNKPLRYRGWKIYQHDYDAASGRYSVLELVRDPWLWAVYAGIFMMLAGAICLMFFMAPKPLREESDEGSGRAQNDRREAV